MQWFQAVVPITVLHLHTNYYMNRKYMLGCKEVVFLSMDHIIFIV